MNGAQGYVVKGKDAYASASIFLPAVGFGRGTSLNFAGSSGTYWSSVPGSDDDAWYLIFNSSYHGTSYSSRYNGRPVRPLQGFTE